MVFTVIVQIIGTICILNESVIYCPTDFYGASSKSGRFLDLFWCSIQIVIFPFSKDLGLLLKNFTSIKFLGTFQQKRFHILMQFQGTGISLRPIDVPLGQLVPLGLLMPLGPLRPLVRPGLLRPYYPTRTAPQCMVAWNCFGNRLFYKR